MCSMRSFLSVFICLICMAGCVSRQPYPDHWPKTVANTATQCPNLAGSYENFGQSDDGSRVVLATLFFPLGLNEPLHNNYDLLAVTHVTLENQGDNDLIVKAWVGDMLLKERLLAASQSPCRDGSVVFPDKSWGLDVVAPFFPVLYHSSVDRLLSVASDGSLVMENQEFSKGVAVVIPLAVKAQYWYRFPRAAPDSPGLLNDANRPRMARTGTTPAYRLLSPKDAPEWSGYKDAGTCLEVAAASAETPDAQAVALLGGRSTQAFIVQDGRDGALLQQGTVVGNNWIPKTHGLRVEKQHWRSPLVADRYVICLLKKGYRWEDPGKGTLN